MRAWLALGVSVVGAAFLLKSRWNYCRLPVLPVSSPRPTDTTVIIPARNEEANINRVVSSLAGERVLVVDDNSTDASAELAQRAGATVLPCPAPTAGVLGKPNACLAGARTASTEWLLFVDADTWFQPGLVASLVAYAERENLDAVTVFLQQECRTWAERIILPYAFALYFCGVNARSVNSPHGSEALANGQCLLFRRSAYERFGGHAAVMGSVIEDVALATEMKRQGIPFRVVRAEHLGHVRMYESWPALLRGFQKNSFRFLLINPVTGAQVVLASVLLTSWLPVVLTLAFSGNAAGALLCALLPTLALWPWYGTPQRRDVAAALCAPAAIYLFQFVALTAMANSLTGRTVQWKGRAV